MIEIDHRHYGDSGFDYESSYRDSSQKSQKKYVNSKNIYQKVGSPLTAKKQSF